MFNHTNPVQTKSHPSPLAGTPTFVEVMATLGAERISEPAPTPAPDALPGSNNFHSRFCTSSETLQKALATYQRHKKAITDATEQGKEGSMQTAAAHQQVIEAEQAVEDAMDALAVAVDTPGEEKAQAQLRKARLALETAKDRHKAIVAKNPPAPELSAEELAVEAAEKLAITHMVAEELNKLPKEALHTLHRAFAIYEGCMRWPAFLEFVLPSLDTREVPQLRADVINEYGIG